MFLGIKEKTRLTYFKYDILTHGAVISMRQKKKTIFYKSIKNNPWTFWLMEYFLITSIGKIKRRFFETKFGGKKTLKQKPAVYFARCQI